MLVLSTHEMLNSVVIKQFVFAVYKLDISLRSDLDFIRSPSHQKNQQRNENATASLISESIVNGKALKQGLRYFTDEYS